MYILLTDYLRCPRCGPEHGLVLLGDRIEARRVLEGVLGCANCREQYVVRGGWADLRGAGVGGPGEAAAAPAGPASSRAGAAGTGGQEAASTAGGGGGAEDAAALRLAALLGVTEGPGFVLVAGPGAELGAGVAALVEGIEVVAVDTEPAGREVVGVSRMAVGRVLPLAPGSMRAVALTGDGGGIALEEAARVVARLGRLVVEQAGPDTVERLEGAGFEVLAREGAVVVAVRR